MDFITSAVNRLARAIGMASETPLGIRDIYHIAFLLHQKLPADLVPMILEYAELWQTIRLDTPHIPERRINEHDSPRLQAGAIVPYYIPKGQIRLIRFKTVSRDQGWSSYPEHHGTYEASWSWFDVGIVEPMDEPVLPCRHRRYEGDHLIGCPAELSTYKWGSKRIVTNVHAGKEFREHVVEWRADDEDFQEMLKEIGGGCAIEVSACAQYPGWYNYVQSVQIEIECPVVRKL